MDLPIDFDQLLRREDASVEWKRNVAEVDDVVAKLVAFANDITGTIPEGWVICGVEDTRDEHGFQQPRLVGLGAARLTQLENKVLALCRQSVEPPLHPDVFEWPVASDPARRILVFHIRSSESSHRFKHRKRGDQYWITSGANTVPARNRLLRQLLRRKDELPPFLERGCRAATLDDIDLVAAEQFLKDARLPRPPAEYLRPGVAIDLFASPLVLEEVAASGETRAIPTYLSLLLFGREPTRFLRSAHVVLSVYEGTDRTAQHSQRFETGGPLPKMIRDVLGTLRLHTGIAIDKSGDLLSRRQNRPRYSEQALQEAVVNAFAHRDYEEPDPTRITVFSDRIEVFNPGGLEAGVDPGDLEAGHYYRWRNAALAGFLLRMELAQREGQGIPTIVRETLEVAGRRPEIRSLNGSFLVALPAYVTPGSAAGARRSASDQTAEVLDLELQVTTSIGGELEVQALVSPRDRPRSRFAPPYTLAEATSLLEDLNRVIEGQTAGGGVATGGPDLGKIGAKLFAALFPPPLRAVLDASLDRLTDEGERLRLRLAFDSQASAPHSALPWEALFHPGKRQFLARRPRVALVRYLDAPVDIRRLFVQPPLRVLLIAPGPGEPGASTVRAEQRLVFETLRQTPGIEVECVEPPTLDQLVARLSQEDVHVLHFVGHGGQEESGRAVLFFEDQAQNEHRVSGRQLAAKLAPFSSSLRLVVLNACRGADGRRRTDQELIVGLPSALIAEGMTAVMVMQLLISHAATICFVRSFYQILAETGQVESATAEARRELYQRERSSPEWISPVVFTRVANGRIFEPSAAPSRDEPLRIGIRSLFGRRVEIEDWSDAFLSLTSFFRGPHMMEGVSWQGGIYPRLATFLRRATVGRRSVHLDLVAHQSIAFAAGYVLDVAGMAVTVRQRTAHDTSDWRVDEPPLPDAWSWRIEEDESDARKPDIALVVSPTRSIRTSVESYLVKALPGIGRIVELRPPAGSSQLSIQNGWHAFRLAEAISNKLNELTAEDWEGTFHLFFAGPNALLFFLGLLPHGRRKIQLYEYDFDGEGDRIYIPSLLFPPPAV
jgi:ATP-dependent DNA helicase RecG